MLKLTKKEKQMSKAQRDRIRDSVAKKTREVRADMEWSLTRKEPPRV